ncbi:MAG: hypothetical protein ACRYFU_06770 [Janthinobacterium lividum]
MVPAHESLLLFGVGLLDILIAVSLAVVRTRPKQESAIPLEISGFQVTNS